MGHLLLRGRAVRLDFHNPAGSRGAGVGPAGRPRGDGGAASVLGIAIIGMLVAALVMTLPLYIGMSVRQGVISAADAAALAAADVVVGIHPGVPCEVAARVATANAAALVGCVVDGAVVTVSTSRTILGLVLSAEATAGPPGSTAD